MEELVKKSIDQIINEFDIRTDMKDTNIQLEDTCFYTRKAVKHLMTKAQHEVHKRYNWNKKNSQLVRSMLVKYRSIQSFVYPMAFMSKIDEDKWTLDELMEYLTVCPLLIEQKWNLDEIMMQGI